MSTATDAHLDLVSLAGEVLSPRMSVLFNAATSLATLFGCGGSSMDSAGVISWTWSSPSAAGTASLAWVLFSGRNRLAASLERGLHLLYGQCQLLDLYRWLFPCLVFAALCGGKENVA